MNEMVGVHALNSKQENEMLQTIGVVLLLSYFSARREVPLREGGGGRINQRPYYATATAIDN